MIFGKTKLELKVGIFVFIGLAILMVFILSIGGFKTWASGYRVKFTFTFINGVKLGAPVRFAGVDVGEVKKINFISDAGKNKVEITAWVKQGVKIPVDSIIWVNTLGLLGEKYVEIIPGTDYSRCLAANQSLAGVEPLPMQEVMQTAKNIVDNLDQAVIKINKQEGTIGKLIYDDTVYNELEAFVKDIRAHPWKLLIKTKEKPVAPKEKPAVPKEKPPEKEKSKKQ